MHPISVIEMISSIVFIAALFIISFAAPKKMRKISLKMAVLAMVITASLFIIRPYWIDHKVMIKTKQLNDYLVEKYPDQHWKITRKIGRQYNPYHLNVEFENEKGWIYSYFVKSASNIKQNGFSVPDGRDSRKAKHFQREDW